MQPSIASTWFFKHRAAKRAKQTEAELAAADAEVDTPVEGTVEAGTIAAAVASAGTHAAADRIVHPHAHDQER